MDYFNRIKVFTFLIISVMLYISCSRSDTIDEVIDNYNNYDFSKFKNVDITFRAKENGLDIYYLSINNSDSLNYVIYYDNILKLVKYVELVSDNDISVENHKDKHHVIDLFNEFITYDFYILACDSKGNVFINPFEANEPIYLLRLSEKSQKKQVKMGYIYRHYKENWYINTYYE